MGNCCCPLSSACDHTVDETRGLLNSDSKALSGAEGAEVHGNSSPKLVTEDSSKHEGENAEPQVLPTEEDPVAGSPEAHAKSSYSSVIQSLHTDLSRAGQAHQCASPGSTYMAKDAGITEEEEEIPDAPLDSTEVPAPTATTEASGEAEAEMHGEVTKASAAVEEVISQEAPTDKAPEAQGEAVQEASGASGEKEEPKALEVLVEEDATQTKKSASDISTTDRRDAQDVPALTDASENADGAEMQAPEYRSVKPRVSSAEAASERDAEEKAESGSVSEEPCAEPADNEEDARLEDASPKMAEVMEDSLPSDAQEHSKRVSPPDMELSSEPTPHNVENGQPNDQGDPRHENTMNVEVTLMPAAVQETETRKELLHTGGQTRVLPEPSSSVSSTAEQVDEPESRDTAADQEKITLSIAKKQEVAESLLNGLDSSAPTQKPEFTETPSDSAQEDDTELKLKVTQPGEALSLEEHMHEEEEPDAQASEKQAEETASVVQETVVKEDTATHKGRKGEIILTSNHGVEVAVIPIPERESCADKKELDDEDLYRGAEETEEEKPKDKQLKALLEFTIPGVEETCSLDAAVDILAYSEREWKGNTAKSALIRKGYSEISCSFSGLRRVRGDNYCALRATLYQALVTSTQTPAWLLEDDFTSLPEKLEAQEHLIRGWMFPSECRQAGEKEGAVQKLQCYLELLQKKWQAAVESYGLEEKQRVCERSFQCGEEEYGLLEALKLLMLARAVEFHKQMQAGQDVPVFCWLLFARDTSENPRTFLTNHLSQIGFGGGVEQVEMFLLGYALQHTIQAFRLYKMDTEEFVTHYPDDHKQDWPCVSVVTEDDRHYNVPVRKPVQHQRNTDLTALLPLVS